MTFINEIEKQMFEEGTIKAKNDKQGKYIVDFHNTFYIYGTYNESVRIEHVAYYFATAKRYYKLIKN